MRWARGGWRRAIKMGRGGGGEGAIEVTPDLRRRGGPFEGRKKQKADRVTLESIRRPWHPPDRSGAAEATGVHSSGGLV
ncbi:hypothetical protein IscW_ISCW001102 [Ixodes scapularis]|uniref:Uncharacterized protein n=1 Tax=Ixodes scapularis TaxID=6945 RepID=B7P6E4_IXOSC|nr:hypothetical protein IscW_ISCW001102 [Ixodes scapularis]|eukprot:XP_002408573.1 hypothetical protein IscW_ISCW001102 [Ixodes scapularis]